VATRLRNPSTCACCRSENRARIEALLAGGASLRAVGERFGLSKDVLHRHMTKHVSPERRAALVVGPARIADLATAAADESRGLLDYLAITRSVLFSQFLIAAEAADRNGVANIGGRLLENLRELGRLTGELRSVSGITVNHNTLNVFGSPEFVALQDGLLRIARNHPAVRSDIVDLLRSLDPRSTASPSMPAPPNGAAVPQLIQGESLP
jgi:hypothetical protein